MPQLALVTGASSGIGFQIARQFADRGYDIIGVGASDRILQLPGKLPRVQVHPVAVDLAADNGVQAAVRMLVRTGDTVLGTNRLATAVRWAALWMPSTWWAAAS